MSELIDAIARGEVPPDASFDRHLPEALAGVSGLFWTPVAVALQAARWLDERGVATVCDVGSGAGKLCVVAALASRCRFVGLEHRAHLVVAARALAETFGVGDRVVFVDGALDPTTLPIADAYYLFNPFGENVAPDEEHLDEVVELSEARHARDVAAMVTFLARAPVGTHALVYNGFGAAMPAGYASVRVDLERPHVLRLWRRVE
ncbi:MAG: methyltransferase [Deltaproteobacteria bacterium]|nr:methyltransferase [Deltaproteobacteria bacterium]